LSIELVCPRATWQLPTRGERPTSSVTQFASFAKTYKSWVCALVFSSYQFNESFSQSQRSTMTFPITTTVTITPPAVGICPGFNFGIGNVKHFGNGNNQCKCYTLPLTVNNDGLFATFSSSFLTGNVYDASCKRVDGLTTVGNPCTQGVFGCSPPPVTFNRYKSTSTGLMLVT
jgi:hypothetical protein